MRNGQARSTSLLTLALSNRNDILQDMCYTARSRRCFIIIKPAACINTQRVRSTPMPRARFYLSENKHTMAVS